MLGSLALALGVVGLGVAALISAADSVNTQAANREFEERLARGHYNEEEEEKRYRYIKRYKRTMSGKDIHLIRFGYGTQFPGGVEHRDLYYLNEEMQELGYDCKRWITFSSLKW